MSISGQAHAAAERSGVRGAREVDLDLVRRGHDGGFHMVGHEADHRFTEPVAAVERLEKEMVDRSVEALHQTLDHLIAGRPHYERMPLRVEFAEEFR